MNDSEFLELLNLYLDHEISAADAARLEGEVQHNTQRRAVYREYCRMHKACTLLTADYQVEEARVGQGAGSRKVVAFDARSTPRSRGIGNYLAASVALAAAGAVLIFVGRGIMPAHNFPQEGGAATVAIQPAVDFGSKQTGFALGSENSGPRGLVAAIGRQGREDGRKEGTLVSESLVLSGSKQAEVVLAVAVQQADDQLAWMHNFQLVSLEKRNQLEQIRFEATPVSMRPDVHHLGGRTPVEATVEMTAFRFVK
jgi:hypothetical protein